MKRLLTLLVICVAATPKSARTEPRSFASVLDEASEFGPGVVEQFRDRGRGGDENPLSTIVDLGGSPNILRVTTSIRNAAGVWYSHETGATFNPSTQGSINSIDFVVEMRDPNLGNDTTGIIPSLIQGEGLNMPPELVSVRGRFRPFDRANTFSKFSAIRFVESDFAQVQRGGEGDSPTIPGSHPDFSTEGGKIVFVLLTCSSTGGATLKRVTDFQNLDIVVDYNPIPEPPAVAELEFSSVTFVPSYGRRKICRRGRVRHMCHKRSCGFWKPIRSRCCRWRRWR